MKNKLKEIIPIFIIVYCLIVIPIILYKYSAYLNKPNNYTWDQVKEYLISSEKYNNEPVVFSPNWLKNYATDYGRLQKLNISGTNNDYKNYWLITIDKKSIPKNYQIIATEEIKKLFIFKLKKIR